MIDLSKSWTELSFVAFDTETSGAYPIGCEVVEFGAVKWQGGREVATMQTLLRPREPMSDFIIGIHGITNEMVADAPLMKDQIQNIRDFFEGSILMAHHAPFDMGFIAFDFEKYGIQAPSEPVLCTSLLARKLIPESHNHKLQTLVSFLGIDGGSAHRALDDARSCLKVGLECFGRTGGLTSVEELTRIQGKKLMWDDYRIHSEKNELIDLVVEAIEKHLPMDIVYQGGSQSGDSRRISPFGLVRNPDGDFVQAKCHRDAANKRFYLGKMSRAVVVKE